MKKKREYRKMRRLYGVTENTDGEDKIPSNERRHSEVNL